MNDYLFTKIRQRFGGTGIADLKGTVAMELKNLEGVIKPGASIAVAVGSRGISNVQVILRELLLFLKEHKAVPFIIPAMGSHGGATAEGQAGILTGYGITEESMGVPVRSSMEVVELAGGEYPHPLFMDKFAHASDGVVLVNRIKPHTDYHGTYESGLVKMAVIGLGKEKQASAIHRYGVYGLSELIPMAAKQLLSHGKILGGIGVVENALDETMSVHAMRADEMLDQEPRLLQVARDHMPALPVTDIDVLIIDQMGKDLSGVGIDPNIIGRLRIAGQKEPARPRIKAIAILDLTSRSHGNAIGMGLADVITRRLHDKIDFSATYANAVTSTFLERAKIPLVASDDRMAVEFALRSCGFIKNGEERIIRIKDTLHLEEMYVSQSILNEVKEASGIDCISSGMALFDAENQCIPF